MGTPATSQTTGNDVAEAGDAVGPTAVFNPKFQAVPIVLASPHSGRHYPEAFIAESRLDPLDLRRSEDGFVDEIFSQGPQLGIPLVAAQFPRAFCDVNREPYELDQKMFKDKLPAFVNTRSVRVACGLGTIARVVSDGAEIYERRLQFAEAEERLTQYYRPYHRDLKKLVDSTVARFGAVLLLDCHSMPSVGGAQDQDAGVGRKDIILGDRYGTSCAPHLVAMVEEKLRALGFEVSRNNPYAGGYTTQIYGRPGRGLNALQIEINRGLYMDEVKVERASGLVELTQKMTEFLTSMSETVGQVLEAPLAD